MAGSWFFLRVCWQPQHGIGKVGTSMSRMRSVRREPQGAVTPLEIAAVFPDAMTAVRALRPWRHAYPGGEVHLAAAFVTIKADIVLLVRA